MRILIVDDDPMFLDLLEGGLAASGFDEVVRATSADDALELIDSQEDLFDCFILDILMPGTDGIELCASIRSRPDCRSAPIIMLTSTDARETMQAAFDTGATDFLNKPLNMIELDARIRMAFLLVKALSSETANARALHALSALSDSADNLDPRARITFSNIDSMHDYDELENEVIKVGKGLFSIWVFSIKIADFKEISRRSTDHELMGLIHMSAGVISRVAPSQRCHFSYLGNGKFVCIVFVRAPLVAELLQTRLCRELTMCVRNADNPAISAAKLEVRPLTDRRIMTTADALMLIRDDGRNLEPVSDVTLPSVENEADRLFEKFQFKK